VENSWRDVNVVRLLGTTEREVGAVGRKYNRTNEDFLVVSIVKERLQVNTDKHIYIQMKPDEYMEKQHKTAIEVFHNQPPLLRVFMECSHRSKNAGDSLNT